MGGTTDLQGGAIDLQGEATDSSGRENPCILFIVIIYIFVFGICLYTKYIRFWLMKFKE